MSDVDWACTHACSLGMGLVGDQITESDDHGQAIRGDSFLILMNARDAVIPFRLGARRREVNWSLLFDTTYSHDQTPPLVFEHMSIYPLQPRSIVILEGHYAPLP
jgi:glycogen operon protein